MSLRLPALLTLLCVSGPAIASTAPDGITPTGSWKALTRCR
ncbi:hypothetical protein [Duncaniella sp. C9]|nr:hypothetical protein [Duncaniella sp. C9]